MTNWIKDKVRTGDKTGSEIGFPTINLNPKKLTNEISEGIYVTEVKIGNDFYGGVLFYGPRLIKNENQNVLEIHILKFSGNIYGQEVEFRIGKFIREVKNFTTHLDLIKEIEKDIKKAKKLMGNNSGDEN